MATLKMMLRTFVNRAVDDMWPVPSRVIARRIEAAADPPLSAADLK